MAAEHVLIELSDAEIIGFLSRFGPIRQACARYGIPADATPYVVPGGKFGVPRVSIGGTILALREVAAPQGDGLPDLLLTSIRTKLAAARALEVEPAPDSVGAASAL